MPLTATAPKLSKSMKRKLGKLRTAERWRALEDEAAEQAIRGPSFRNSV